MRPLCPPEIFPADAIVCTYTAVSNGIWGQVCLSGLCLFFLSILKDQISLLNGALYGSPKCFLWTFAKNVMTGSQLTKNGFFPPKNYVFSKIFTEKNTFLETSAPALKGHIVRHHLEKTRTFYLSREKKNKHFCVKNTKPQKIKKNSTAS